MSLSGLSADDKDKKREQGKEHEERGREKREEARDKKDEKGKDKKDKKSQARQIAHLQKRIAHLKQVAADLDAKGNSEAAANVRKTIERAEAKLAEKQKALGINDADVKAADAPEGETK